MAQQLADENVISSNFAEQSFSAALAYASHDRFVAVHGSLKRPVSSQNQQITRAIISFDYNEEGGVVGEW